MCNRQFGNYCRIIEMASEAQRLIGISLTKIAQSRTHRGGVSLHKNLLVATVLQKARYIFMEEAYQMVHCHSSIQPIQPRQLTSTEDNLIGLTVEEAGLESSSLTSGFHQESSSSSSSSSVETNQDEPSDFLHSSSISASSSSTTSTSTSSYIKCVEQQQQQQQDKENHPPYSNELTYLDLDKTSNVLRERSNSTLSTTSSSSSSSSSSTSISLKRRRTMTEWETEEAVQSILPKKLRPDDDEISETLSDDSSSTISSSSSSCSSSSSDDSVFLDDATLLSDIVSKEIVEVERCQQETPTTTAGGSAMEIDRITSLVSIFSFSMSGSDSSSCGSGGGGGGGCGGGSGVPNGSSSNKLSRSMSTPDLCSAQAKDSSESIQQQRPFLAMTV